MKRIYLLIAIGILPCCAVKAQKHHVNYRAELGGGTAAKPFWLHTNTRNKIAPDTYLWGNVGLFTDFAKSDTRAFDYSLGTEGTGVLGQYHNRIFVNQLFGKIRWQNLTLNVGLFDRPTCYDGLSATNGDLLYSNNSRNMPGISLASWDYIKLPGKVGRYLSFKFRYAEQMMLDNRYVENTRVHNKMAAGKITFSPQFSIEGGIEDYAQWGGKGVDGKNRYTLKDYVKLVCVLSGGENASRSDQINRLGNHIGNYFVRINYGNSKLGISFYYNHLFEDGSGGRFKNAPDGLYGLYLTRKDSDRWFKSFVYEFYYTKDQSGPRHDRPATEEEIAQKAPSDPFPDRVILGGADNYFNNGGYPSGWSLYGQIIGLPFITPTPATDGIIRGTYNNRILAHHFGLSGALPLLDIQYKLLCSYSLNYGRHSDPFLDETGKAISKPQFSFGLQLTAPEKHLPFATTLSLGFDKGDLLQNRFGIMLSILKIGLF